MKTPQIIVIICVSTSLLAAAYLHGREKEGEYNFWGTLLSDAILIGLLIWGDFFN
jgi:hypothetical protein